MLLDERMRREGAALFRWRSYVIVVFLPAVVWAAASGEPVEAFVGARLGGLWEAASVALVLGSLALRAWVVGRAPEGTSGRNTRRQIARTLNVTGAYSLVRNPLYLANGIGCLGVGLYTQHLGLALALVLAVAMAYERIILAEEAFLRERFGAAYAAWAAEVPAIWPRAHGWRPPAEPFDWGRVWRREPPSWMGAAAALALVGIPSAWAEGEPGRAWAWGGLVLAVGLVQAALLAAKRRGRRAAA